MSIPFARLLDLDHPGSRAIRLSRAATVTALIALGWLPLATGSARCLIARVFHRPCPGCGITRALALIASGRLAQSLELHALAFPAALAHLALAVALIAATVATGSPLAIIRTRYGRAVIVYAATVLIAALALWLARSFGYAGGPVPVD